MSYKTCIKNIKNTINVFQGIPYLTDCPKPNLMNDCPKPDCPWDEAAEAHRRRNRAILLTGLLAALCSLGYVSYRNY